MQHRPFHCCIINVSVEGQVALEVCAGERVSLCVLERESEIKTAAQVSKPPPPTPRVM